MVNLPLIAAIAAGMMMTGFAANEMTHGGMAESMGMGHQHMLDHGGYHCAEPGSAHWENHEAHMHDGNMTDHCGGGHMGMNGHPGMGSGMGHGMMGGSTGSTMMRDA
jgi:hypothetical protein